MFILAVAIVALIIALITLTVLIAAARGDSLLRQSLENIYNNYAHEKDVERVTHALRASTDDNHARIYALYKALGYTYVDPQQALPAAVKKDTPQDATNS